jgi:sterol desaturase/sphingolipid hydroxylase (fatty acid hydroxylase superfamily)
MQLSDPVLPRTKNNTPLWKKSLRLPWFDAIGFPLIAGSVVVFFVMETRRELRKRKERRTRRMRRNLLMASTAVGVLRLVMIPALVYAAYRSREKDFGLLNRLKLPAGLNYGLAFLLLDYLNYHWHRTTHRFPGLWRFHNVHHNDLDLDSTTALRFHAGEVLISVLYRGAAVALTGAPPGLVWIYEIFFETATNFHHSNWRLPYTLEKRLARFIVTPRMHGVHHSIVQRETNSNYSVIFSWWDRLHGTIRLNVPQDEINIGVPAYRSPQEQTVGNLLLMPFREQRPWQLPDGTVPDRPERTDYTHMLE